MVIMELNKNTKNNGKLTIKEIDKNLAKDICIKNHYSKKWADPFGKINFGIYQNDSDECLGVLVFGLMMNPNSYKSISSNIEKHNIIELNRMWLDDCLGKNAETTCLAMCIKYIKRNYPEIKIIQTFADGRLGCGTVYKAANFKYYGYHETLFFENIHNGEVYHKTSFEDSRWLVPMIARTLLLSKEVLRPFKVKTYRYLYILDKRLKNSIKLKELEYPKYEKSMVYTEFKLGIATLARVHTILSIDEEFKVERCIVENYIMSNYENNIEELYDISLTSKEIVKRLDKLDNTIKYINNNLRPYLIKNNMAKYIYEYNFDIENNKTK